MPEMYIKYRGYKPYAYMYGDESAATALYYGDGYKNAGGSRGSVEESAG